MPEILLGRRARRVLVGRIRVSAHQVAGVPAPHPRRLHAAGGREVGGPERQALHARAGAADLLHVGDAGGRLQDRVHQERPLQLRLGLQLRQQAVDVVDVPGSLDLRDHDDFESVPDRGHHLGEVVQDPG